YNKSLVMEMVIVFFATDCSPALDLGKSNFTTCGLDTAEANKKNNIRKNMMSFSAAVCTSAEGLFLLLRKFIFCLSRVFQKDYILGSSNKSINSIASVSMRRIKRSTIMFKMWYPI